jgi:RNA-directed DNA polymerase
LTIAAHEFTRCQVPTIAGAASAVVDVGAEVVVLAVPSSSSEPQPAIGTRIAAARAAVPKPRRLSDLTRLISSSAHIDEGFDFLGFRIQRRRQRGSNKRFVYTWPSKKALASVKAKVRAITRGGTNQPLAVVLRRLNPVLRGWANYFRHGVSKATFDYLNAFSWRRVICWLRHKHRRANWKWLRRRYLPGWRPTDGEVTLFNPASIAVTRYGYRGGQIPTPWTRAEATVA